jgi:hypothetical protein
MGITLNQKIYETPADVKKTIYDRGYEAGSRDTIERIFTKLSEDLRGFVGLNYLEFLKNQCESEVQNAR